MARANFEYGALNVDGATTDQNIAGDFSYARIEHVAGPAFDVVWTFGGATQTKTVGVGETFEMPATSRPYQHSLSVALTAPSSTANIFVKY